MERNSTIALLSKFEKLNHSSYWPVIVIVRVLENARTIMENGIPELQVPPIDPIQLDLVEFRFFNLTTKFKGLSMRGLKDFKLKKSEVNKAER